MKSPSHVRLFATPWTVTYQATQTMGFSRQQCWSGLPFPSPGDLSDPGIEPESPALQADALPSEPPGKPNTAERICVTQTCLARNTKESPYSSHVLTPDIHSTFIKYSFRCHIHCEALPGKPVKITISDLSHFLCPFLTAFNHVRCHHLAYCMSEDCVPNQNTHIMLTSILPFVSFSLFYYILFLPRKESYKRIFFCKFVYFVYSWVRVMH